MEWCVSVCTRVCAFVYVCGVCAHVCVCIASVPRTDSRLEQPVLREEASSHSRGGSCWQKPHQHGGQEPEPHLESGSRGLRDDVRRHGENAGGGPGEETFCYGFLVF